MEHVGPLRSKRYQRRFQDLYSAQEFLHVVSNLEICSARRLLDRHNQQSASSSSSYWRSGRPATAQFTLTGCNAAYVPAQIAASTCPRCQLCNPLTALYYTDCNQYSNLVHLPTIPISNGNFFTTTLPPSCVFTFVANAAMSATITSPLTGAQFSNPTAIPVNATVSAAVGSVSRVDYYCGTTNIGTSTNLSVRDRLEQSRAGQLHPDRTGQQLARQYCHFGPR